MTRIDQIRARLAAATPDATSEDEYARSLQDRKDPRDLLDGIEALREIKKVAFAIQDGMHPARAARLSRTEVFNLGGRIDEIAGVILSRLDSPVGDEGAE